MSDAPSADAQPLLEGLYAKYVALQRKNTNKLAQHAHMQWVCEGDRNSKFFHNTTHIRKNFNSISQVCVLNNNLFSDCASIENAFMNFYSQFWSNSSNDSFFDILNAFPNDLPQLSSLDCDYITQNVTREEVQLTIFELLSGKSPGLAVLTPSFILFFRLKLATITLKLFNIFWLTPSCLNLVAKLLSPLSLKKTILV